MSDLAHFAIHVDDLDRAQRFYEKVFDWKYESYQGADGFAQIKTTDSKLIGAVR